MKWAGMLFGNLNETLKLPKGQPKRGPTFCFYPKRDSCKSKLHESGKVYNFYTFLHVQP